MLTVFNATYVYNQLYIINIDDAISIGSMFIAYGMSMYEKNIWQKGQIENMCVSDKKKKKTKSKEKKKKIK